jgi:tyrosinase
MHTRVSRRQAHGNSAFLPWHRAYLLDLERELQAIDGSVALPYWRFDKPAPALFTEDYLGSPDPRGRLRFRPGHPFEGWVTDGQPGIVRAFRFDPRNPPALSVEDDVLAMGGEGARYGDFIGMEGDPHGLAHTSFVGPIDQVPTAARDPLFFMLHNNVDRLWAKWQWLMRRMDPDHPDGYAAPSPDDDGHRLDDTMWPWNRITGGSRPPTAPGGHLASSPVTPAPGPSPRVRDMIDYQGSAGGSWLGFAYDDVPFEA